MTEIIIAHQRYAPPAASNFTTIVGTNSETPTLTDTTDRGLLFSFGSSPAAGDNWRYAVKNKPTASNYDIIARIMSTPLGYSYFQPALVLTDGTKLVIFGMHNGSNAPLLWTCQQWNSQTSFSANVLATDSQSRVPTCDYWLRIGIVSGVPTDFYVSQNGQDWVKVASSSQAGFLTFTKIGFGCNVNRNGQLQPIASTPQAFMNIMYWADADIAPGI